MLFASVDESRYVLISVHFDLSGLLPLMVATDGRRLCVIETEADQKEFTPGATQSFSLSTDFLKPLCAFGKSQSTILEIDYHGPKRAVFTLNEGKCTVDCEDGAIIEPEYPKWRSTIPTKTDTAPVPFLAFNSALMADFSKAAKLLRADSGLKMNLISPGSAIEVLIDGNPKFYGLIMPMRLEEPPKWQPEFLLVNGTAKPEMATP